MLDPGMSSDSMEILGRKGDSPRALRTAHAEGGGSHVVATTEGRSRFSLSRRSCTARSTYPSGMNRPEKRELIKINKS